MDQPQARTFGALVREMADRYPDRPALWFEGSETTFAELDRRVDEIAKGLIALGVGADDVVSVLSPNSPEWLSITVAAARIGATSAPINTFYKRDEVEWLLDHAETTVVFTVDQLRSQDYRELWRSIVPELDERSGTVSSERFPNLRAVVQVGDHRFPGSFGLDDLVELGRAVSDAALTQAEDLVEPESRLFILYTSGSTSTPKGVPLLHGPAIVNGFNIGEREGLDETDRYWLVLPLFWSAASIKTLPAVWTHGACLVVQSVFEANEALQILEDSGATAYFALGNITRALAEQHERAPRDLSRVSKGTTGMTRDDKQRALELFTDTQAITAYGLTESYGLFATTSFDDDRETLLSTQGLPLPGWEYRVVDPESGAEISDTELGELQIRGHLTPGYHRDPVATAAAFTADGYFKTGDLVRFDRDGRLQFEARLKEMIKTGGINVSPVEVETMLASHESVTQAHVVGVWDERRGEIIVAFVELSSEISEDQLRAYAAERSAAYKVPHRIIICSDADLPRTMSGKVQKFKLAEKAQSLGVDLVEGSR